MKRGKEGKNGNAKKGRERKDKRKSANSLPNHIKNNSKGRKIKIVKNDSFKLFILLYFVN